LLNLWLLRANAKMLNRWCEDHKTWTSDDWKYAIWSDESPFASLPTSGRVYVWRTHKETCNPECLVPTVKHGSRCLLIWAAISFYSADPMVLLNGRITASEYGDILGNLVHPVVQMFPENYSSFQYDISPIHIASQKCSVLV